MTSLAPGLIYQGALRFFQYFPLVGSILFFTDAPHGRFSPHLSKSKVWVEKLTINGTLAWIIMELPSPATLLYTYRTCPLSSNSRHPSWYHPSTLLVGLYVVHYANRAIISPLRTASRSRSHLIIPLASIVFNVVNGGLMGSWLSSGVIEQQGWNKLTFWAALGLFAVGLIGNIVHDEVLLSIRRNAQKGDTEQEKSSGPKYGVPHGYLYRFISYPNYFCEWMEWTGFAVAASVASNWSTPLYQTPPWLFVVNEVALMLPRALSGHRWYHEKFNDYPRDRKAIIPFVL